MAGDTQRFEPPVVVREGGKKAGEKHQGNDPECQRGTTRYTYIDGIHSGLHGQHRDQRHATSGLKSRPQ